MAYKVIDVSSWQGIIDWEKVKADGVIGAIVRYGDGNIVDSKFDRNMKECKRLGIHVGSYIYSRAVNASMAKDEARRIINACKPYGCDLPIYIDCEWDGQARVANTVCSAFLSVCNASGVKGGIYANLNWFNHYINAMSFKKYPLWIAQYFTRITYHDPSIFGMWQYTSKGKVKGISGNVDMNQLYIKYWEGNTPNPAKEPLKVDGLFGKASTLRLQEWLKTPLDGIISGQTESVKPYIPNLISATYTGKGGSTCIKALQKYLKAKKYEVGTIDGLCGKQTVTALQKFLKAEKFDPGTIDGVFGVKSAKALQKYLNKVFS